MEKLLANRLEEFVDALMLKIDQIDKRLAELERNRRCEFITVPETTVTGECKRCQFWTPENTTQLGVCRESSQPHAKVPTDGCQRFKPILETEHITE